MRTNSATARDRLADLLGNRARSQWQLLSESISMHGDVRIAQLMLSRQDGETARAFLTGPARTWKEQPALVYCHAHGGRYDIGADELIEGRPALQGPAYAAVLAARGIVALCLDLPCFGTRAGETESARAKRRLWHGETLFGEMLADSLGAFDFLAAQPGIDGTRIGAFGISMGATLAFWLAALEPRLKCLAHLCCFADLETLVTGGGHDRHGNYMTVPGLIPAFSTGDIAGLAAPRPQLACMGLLDALTPPAAIDIAVRDARTAYDSAGAGGNFALLIEPDTGHMETPRMREAVLSFFETAL